MFNGTYYMSRRDDKTFLCVFDFPHQPGKGIFDKAKDAIVRSLSSPSPRTNRVREQGSLVDHCPDFHRRKMKSEASQVAASSLSKFRSSKVQTFVSNITVAQS